MNTPDLLDLYADLCEHHAADVARNAIVPKASPRKRKPVPACPDCGRKGERLGHQDCMYPGASGAWSGQ